MPICPPDPGQSRATRAHLELLAARLHPDDGPRAPSAFLGLQPEYLPQELVLGGVDQGEDVPVQHIPILLQEACGEAEPHPPPAQTGEGRGRRRQEAAMPASTSPRLGISACAEHQVMSHLLPAAPTTLHPHPKLPHPSLHPPQGVSPLPWYLCPTPGASPLLMAYGPKRFLGRSSLLSPPG